MKHFIFALALLGAAATGAHAGGSIPDLKGTWMGKGKALIYGINEHHPAASPPAAPRVLESQAIHTIEGQDGQLVWGRYSSAAADTKEPFAWVISRNNKTIIGADTDGYYLITLLAPNQMEKCYTHTSQSPSKSIVATCQILTRVKK